MSAPDRITLVLRPTEGSSLEKIAPFAEAGMSVAVGRSLAVVDAKIDGNLALHAQEMFSLLRRINVKVGGYDAVLGHGCEPSEQMWMERNQALDDICDLLAKVQGHAPAAERTAEESSGVATHAHIDDLVKEAAAEPVFLTAVFKLPNAQAAGALVEQLPLREKVLGTEAVVFGLTTGNAMEDEPCAS